MDHEEFVKILKQYDFKNNSMRKFSRQFNIHHHTVAKYIKLLGIEYNKKGLQYAPHKKLEIMERRQEKGFVPKSILVQAKKTNTKSKKPVKKFKIVEEVSDDEYYQKQLKKFSKMTI